MMNLNIEIPDEIGLELRRRATAAGKDLASFIGQVVVESAEAQPSSHWDPKRVANFERRLDAWTSLHPILDHAIDDGRESFYAGCE